MTDFGHAPIPAGPPANSGKATASLVLGIVSIPLQCCCISLITGILAIVFGMMAKKEIAMSGGMLSGEGKAKAGIICGIVGIVIWAAITVLTVATGSFEFNSTGF